MNIELKIMYDQCIELSETLVAMEMSVEFLALLDQFTNSFVQLSQILQKCEDPTVVDTEYLGKMMDKVEAKLAKERERILKETKDAALKKMKLPLYGITSIITPKKFDHKS